MSNVIQNVYPVDYTGTKATNLISNENITLENGNIRAFSPLFAPFFKKNIVIKDNLTNLTLASTQYTCYNLVASASALSGIGNDVYSIIIITDHAVSSNLSVTYQTVGGNYTTGYDTILSLVNNILSTNSGTNSNPVGWHSVENLPAGFPEALHIHSLENTVGWEFVASELEQLKLAILLGDQVNKNFVLTYIDNVIANQVLALTNIASPGGPFGDHIADVDNPHNVTAAQLELGNVQNYALATLAQAYTGTRSDLYVTADQVAAVVQNAVNMGIDAHILDTDNPHNDTAADLGLGNVQNFGLATVTDLNVPVSGTSKYVTNTVLAAWLNQYFAVQNGNVSNSLGTVTQQAQAAITAADAATAASTAAQATVTAAVATIAAATTNANNALAAANQNVLSSTNSTSHAMDLINTYVAAAVAAARTEYYSKGYADGLAGV